MVKHHNVTINGDKL